MLRTLLFTLTLGAAALCLAPSAQAQGKTYTDSDWNTALRDSCGLPNPRSVSRVSVGGDRKLKFTLEEGDKGKCSTDNRARHRAPFWERAELSQRDRMQIGKHYRISAEVTFMSGFTGQREAFMQIHGWATDCQHAYPPVMLKFNKGRLSVETLRGVSKTSSGRHRNALREKVSVKALYGKPMIWEMQFDTRTRPGRFSLSMGGREIVSDVAVDFAACAVPYVKIGVYRPGGKGSGRSVVMFDDVRVGRGK